MKLRFPRMEDLKKLSFFLICSILTLTLSISLTSCEAEITFGRDNYDWANERLCESYWVTEWEGDFHQLHRTELYFDYDGTGEEVYLVYNRMGYVIEERHSRMLWDWMNGGCTSLRMRFGDGDSYIEDIYWHGNSMSCYWDDIETVFVRGY